MYVYIYIKRARVYFVTNNRRNRYTLAVRVIGTFLRRGFVVRIRLRYFFIIYRSPVLDNRSKISIFSPPHPHQIFAVQKPVGSRQSSVDDADSDNPPHHTEKIFSEN